MPLGTILWGASSSGYTYANTLTFGYPLYDWITDRVQRPGSAQVQSVAGTEDSWITGRDYQITCMARWIPDNSSGTGGTPARTLVAGPVQWQDFLDYARAKNKFRFVPDSVNAPNFYVDGCYLVQPITGFGQNSPRFDREVQLVIRNPTVDFTNALRGIMFEYAPGMSLTDPLSATFTRADATTCATYVDTVGVIHTVPANVLRDQHYTGTGRSTRTTLLEGSRTNGWVRSQQLDNASWTKYNATVSADNITAPDGTVTADYVQEDNTNNLHGFDQTLPALTNNTNSTVSVFALKDTVRNWVLCRTLDKSNTDRRTWFNISAGTIGTKDANHTASIETFNTTAGLTWYRCSITFNASVGATTPVAQWFVASGDAVGAYLGNGVNGCRFWGMQFEADQPFPSSYIATVAATVTRAADSLSFPLVVGNQTPQAMTVYTKIVHQGANNTSEVVDIGNFVTGTADTVVLRWNAAGSAYEILRRISGGSTVNEVGGVTPSAGDTIELRGTVATTGAVQLGTSINGAAESVTVLSATLALGTAYENNTISVGVRSDGSNPGFAAFRSVRVGAAVQTLAQMRTL